MDEYIRFKIATKKKVEFQEAIEKTNPNLNMASVTLTLIEDYIASSKKDKNRWISYYSKDGTWY